MSLVPSPPRLLRYTFGPHDRITLGYGTPKTRYLRWVRSDPDSYIFEDMDRRGFFEYVPLEKFTDITRSPGYRYEPNYYDFTNVRIRAERKADAFADIPPRERPRVRFRLAILLRVEKRRAAGTMSLSDASIRKNLPLIAEEIDEERKKLEINTRPGAIIARQRLPRDPQTIRTWRQMLIEGGNNPAALQTNYGNCGADPKQYPPEFAEKIAARVAEFGSESEPTKISLYTNLKGDFKELNWARQQAGLETIHPPCYRKFSDRIDALPKFAVIAGRRGIDYASRLFHPSSGGVQTYRPGERVEFDEFNIHLHTVAEDTALWTILPDDIKMRIARGRWWASVAMDHATRYWLAIRLTRQPSTTSALATLSMAVSDKGVYADAVGALSPWNGALVPCIPATDSASWNTGEFQDALLGLGGMPLVPTTGIPQLRGTLERSFRTCDTRLLTRFSGRAFGDIVKLGDYPAEARASITDEQLAWIFVRYAVDIYHNSPHEGIDGQTPANAFARGVDKYGLRPLPDKHVRRNVFGLKLTRILRPTGVRILNLLYSSPQLQVHIRRVGFIETGVRLDPTDIGWVSVLIDKDNDIWLSVPCLVEGFDNVHAEDWIATRRHLRKQYAEEANIAEDIVFATLREIEKLADMAVRHSIGSIMLTDEEVNQAEDRLQIPWRARPDLAPEYGGTDYNEPFLSDSISSSRASEPTAASPASTPPAAPSELPKARARRFKIED